MGTMTRLVSLLMRHYVRNLYVLYSLYSLYAISPPIERFAQQPANNVSLCPAASHSEQERRRAP